MDAVPKDALGGAFERWAPLALALLFLLAPVGGRALLQRVRHGTWGVALFRSRGRWAWLRDAGVVALFTLILAQAAAAALQPELVDSQRLARGGLARDLRIGGVALGLFGLSLMIAAQLQMGASWRIGIEEGIAPGLVTRGPFRVSRNPIFVGLLAVLAGYALVLPTWLSLGMLLGTALGVRSQVRAEEAWLLGTYGEPYRAYASRVGRFLPGLGRLD